MAKEKKAKKAKKRAGMQESGFCFLEHTADIKAHAWGPNFCAALVQAAKAMFFVLGGGKPKESMEIEEKAQDQSQLVVGFLSKILAESESREMLPVSIKLIGCDEKKLCIKAKIGLSDARPKDLIKAVTYHQLEIKEGKKRCSIKIVFDV
jgi:SHS2 domain-containing protein